LQALRSEDSRKKGHPMARKWELWSENGGSVLTFIPEDHPEKAKLTKNSSMIWSIAGRSYFDVMRKYYEYKDYETYAPDPDDTDIVY